MVFDSSDILGLLETHAYAVLLPLAVVEGPLVTIAAGALIATGHLRFWPVLAIVVAGDLIGDSALYALGRWGGTRMIAKWAGHGTIARADALQDRFLHKADRALITGKLTHAVGVLILIVAGIVKMPFPRFLGVNFLSTLPKSLVLILAGYAFGSGYAAIGQNMTYYYLVLLIVGVIALYFLVFR